MQKEQERLARDGANTSILSSAATDQLASRIYEARLRSVEIMELEIERVKYLMKAYLRCRLDKIQTYARWLVTVPAGGGGGGGIKQKDGSVIDRLSVPEQDYLKSYVRIVEQHYYKSCFEMLPVQLHQVANDAVVPPDMDAPVFVHVKHDDIGSIQLGDNQELALEKGSIYLLPYRHIVQLLKQDQLNLL